MKILYYSPHPTHDIVSEVGYATHQREIIEALKRAGHNVLPVILGGTDTDTLPVISGENYRPGKLKALLKKIIPRFVWTTLNNIRLLKHDRYAAGILEKNILDFKPDLVYERSEYLQDSGTKMCLKYKLKHFIEVNAPFVEEMHDFEGYSLLQGLAHKKEKFKYRHADQVFCVSSALAKFLIDTYQCNPEKIIVQPNCINPGRWKVNESEVLRIRKKCLAGEGKIIGFVGSMFPYHGVDVLIKAYASLVPDREIKSALLIVGDGAVMPELKELTNKLGVQEQVFFTGKIPHDQVFNYIAAMDVCVMARSNWYGSPVKLFEYGLMKKPVIAPENGPVCDVMRHMEDAWLLGKGESELQNALEKLILDAGLANRLAANLHHKILHDFTWDIAAERIIKACT